MIGDERLLWARFRIVLWFMARSMAVRIRGFDLAPLLAAYEPGEARPLVGLAAEDMLAAIRRVTHHPWTMRDRRCLRQGLLAYRYLTMAGYRPALHFGVDRNSLGNPRVSAHCWIVLDGTVVLNPPSQGMVTIFIYDGPRSFAGVRLPAIEAADRSAA